MADSRSVTSRVGRGVVPRVGIEAGGEELGEQAGDLRVRAQRLLDVVLAERRARLTQVPAQRPDDRDLASQAREQHEPVEPVGLGVAAPDARERLLEPFVVALGRKDAFGRVLEAEVVDPADRPAFACDAVRPLVDHGHAETFENG